MLSRFRTTEQTPAARVTTSVRAPGKRAGAYLQLHVLIGARAYPAAQCFQRARPGRPSVGLARPGLWGCQGSLACRPQAGVTLA